MKVFRLRENLCKKSREKKNLYKHSLKLKVKRIMQSKYKLDQRRK